MLLTLDHLSKFYGDRQVLDDVSLALGSGQRIGLVGANGVGKSTLLKIAAGAVEPDVGSVMLASGVRLGYLPQTLDVPGEQTITAVLDTALGDLHALEAHLHDLEARMATDDDLDGIMAAYGEALERFERQGGYDLDHHQ